MEEVKINKKEAEGSLIAIFGSTGDLSKRKLIPGLYNLFAKGFINNNNPIVCVGRRDISKEEFIKLLEVEKFVFDFEEDKFNKFLEQLYYYKIDLETEEGTEDFKPFLKELEKKHDYNGNKIFYLSIPPGIFDSAVNIINKSSVLSNDGWHRIVFEKPFGNDLASARQLNEHISKVFKEEEIYRVDHYLAKDLVQNILVFRFANSIFEEGWNHKFIDHVQITIAESLGIEKRAGYYESVGAIRDVIQNHGLQILSLVAMEPPNSINADDIWNEKVKVLKALQKLSTDDILVGQYGKGKIDGEEVVAYKDEEGIDKNSDTETYAALRVNINNFRWKGVPFYMRTGKRLKQRYAEVNIVLKDVASTLFSEKFYGANIISIRIQPDEGIAIKFNAKKPSSEMKLQPVAMEYCHVCEFGLNITESYEILLREIIAGDQTLFTRWDNIEESWKFTEHLLDVVKQKKVEFPNYSAGTSGPKEADEMIQKDNSEWIMFNRKVTQ